MNTQTAEWQSVSCCCLNSPRLQTRCWWMLFTINLSSMQSLNFLFCLVSFLCIVKASNMDFFCHWCLLSHSTKKPVTTMLTYPWNCTVLHCNHLGNTWKPLALMTWHFDYCPSASEGDNQCVGSSALLLDCTVIAYQILLDTYKPHQQTQDVLFGFSDFSCFLLYTVKLWNMDTSFVNDACKRQDNNLMNLWYAAIWLGCNFRTHVGG